MLEFFSPDEEATARLAAQIASRAQSGDVFALYGTLGMGKSVFARAFIQALTGAEEVPSPTFTLLQTYDAPEFEIYHYDLYRLKSPEEVFELNIEEAIYGGVCLIEWPENFDTGIGENAYQRQQPSQPAQGNAFQQFMSSLGGAGQARNDQGFNPQALPSFTSPARVINGDTLQIQGRYFKLYGIDAPEANQTCADKTGRSYNCGRQAALWLKGWIGDNPLDCRIMQQDKKGNMVGTCALGEYDLGAALVNAGWAVAYTKYTDIYVPYEQQAQLNGNGLWQGKFYKPWDWRALQAQKPKIKVIKPKKRRENFLGL